MKSTIRSTLNQALATLLTASPFLATRLGETGHDERSDDRSPAGRKRWSAALDEAERQLHTIDRLELHAHEQLELDALESLIEVARRTESDLMPANRDADVYVRDLGWALFGVLARSSSAQERARCLLARLENVGAWIETACRNLDEGYDIPAVWTRTAIVRLEHLDRDFRHLLHPFAETTGSLAERLGDAVEGARRKLIRFRDHLERRVLPRSDGSHAVGKSFFEFVLARRHGIKQNALEIAREAEERFQEKQAQLEAHVRDLGLAGDVPATIAHLQKRRPAASRLLESYEDALRSAFERLAEFDLPAPPSLSQPFAREAPAFLHVDTASARLEPLALLGRPLAAVFVVPLTRELDSAHAADRMAEHSTYLVQLRAIREGFPGKALHFGFASRASSRIRRLLRSGATLEGWGLFALELAHARGRFKNPRLLAMYRLEELRTALLAVLDVRLHLQALAFEDAVAELRTHGHYPAAVATAIARRLAHRPTEAAAAFAGLAALRALRNEWAELRGERFKESEFCERVLRMGGAPISAIRTALLR